jgi:predicted nuclease of predicted toxin-antitoxin system
LKFKADENLPGEHAALRAAGYEADTVADQKLSGSDDSTLVERCRTEDRILLTLDLDFANVQAYPPKSHSGIVVFRPNSQDELTLISLLKRMLPVLSRRSLRQQLWIVEQGRI